MSLSVFLRTLLFHVAAALSVLSIVLLIGEVFVPGSVLPLLDGVHLLLVAAIFVVCSAFFPPSDTPTNPS